MQNKLVKRLILMLLITLTALFSFACESENPLQAKLVGNWSDVAEDGSFGSFTFQEDHTVLMNFDGEQKTLQYLISGEDYPAIILLSDIGDSENFYKSEFSFVGDNELILIAEDGTEITVTKDR
jgi:hypothetical protein